MRLCSQSVKSVLLNSAFFRVALPIFSLDKHLLFYITLAINLRAFSLFYFHTFLETIFWLLMLYYRSVNLLFTISFTFSTLKYT
jgi:hypothetical protein